jgi:hypothetical protein
MPYRLIRLLDDTLVEIETDAGAAQPMASAAQRVSASLDQIEPVLLNACRPISKACKELNQEIRIEQTEVELGLSFEGEGNLYVTKAKAGANLTVRLVLKPVE